MFPSRILLNWAVSLLLIPKVENSWRSKMAGVSQRISFVMTMFELLSEIKCYFVLLKRILVLRKAFFE